MRAAYEARIAGDRAVATESWDVPGGVRLSTPELPAVRDYNGIVLAPGSPIGVVDDVARVNAFDPAGDVPPGWDAVELLVMAFAGPAPARPDTVTEVGADVLAGARTAMWRSLGVEGAGLRELLEMQARQAAAGRLFAVLRDGSPLGWAQVIAGFVDDVFVAEGERRRGLGRDLSLAAMSAGGRFLTVEPDNGPAVALYRSLGFTDAGTLVHLTRAG